MPVQDSGCYDRPFIGFSGYFNWWDSCVTGDLLTPGARTSADLE